MFHLLAVIVSFSIIAQQTAFADPMPSAAERANLPAGISCTTPDTVAYGASADEPGATLEISLLNSADESPMWNNDGASMGMEFNPGSVAIYFSNGCDNDYNFVFVTNDLIALAKDKSVTIRGLLRFENAFGEGVAMTTVVTCKSL